MSRIESDNPPPVIVSIEEKFPADVGLKRTYSVSLRRVAPTPGRIKDGLKLTPSGETSKWVRAVTTREVSMPMEVTTICCAGLLSPNAIVGNVSESCWMDIAGVMGFMLKLEILSST